ncbi:DMT family transporter [Variovorax humicola]|uniref:DMT family transporter n=1 Tax=Variovorax humicola TaxID=1769758 RepID=A0ABU8W9C0_9BURK
MPVAPRLSPRAVGFGAAVITVLVWTAFIVIARASATRSLLPFDIAVARMCGASLVLMPWGAWLVRKAKREAGGGPVVSSMFGLSPLGLRVTALGGVFGGLGYALVAYCGFFYAPAAHASVLMPGSLPLWTTLLAALVLRDRITKMRAAGLALIVVGDLLVGGSSLLHAFEGGEIWKGDLLFMSAAFCWACYSIVVRRNGLDAVRATIAITVFATMTFVPAYGLLAAAGWITSHLGTAPRGEIAFQMLFQGLGSVVISGITFTRMIQYFGPVRSTMITALVPGLSAFGAVVFLAEPLHWSLLAGLLLVTGGILFGVQRVQRVQPNAPKAATPLARVAGQADA